MVTNSIIINKREIPSSFTVESFTIRQSHYAHHSFELSLSIPYSQSFELDQLKSWLGEKITIEWGEDNQFVGFVDNAKIYSVRSNRMVHLEGFSPSILMDAGPKFRAFTEMTLQDIIQHILQEYEGITFDAGIKKSVQWAMQCQESDFRFLNRLADKFGVNFFYDGTEFYFESFAEASKQAIKIEPNELSTLEVGLNLAPLNFEVRGYNLAEDKMKKVDFSDTEIKSKNPLVQAALDKSEQYPKVRYGLSYPIESAPYLKNVAEQLAMQQTNELVNINGQSAKSNLAIGQKITIGQQEDKALPGITDQTAYLITQISHQFSVGNNYQNSFAAIPADCPFPVNVPSAKNPFSGPLLAKVMENKDDENWGRVKVTFLQDENEAVSPWMRVVTNYTAFGGHFWIPEIGETVIVFFEEFNPENSAFVIGSFFNGATLPSSNNPKTRGFSFENIQVVFDDEKGAVRIKAKSILMEADTDIQATAKEGISLDGGTNIKQKAKRIDLN